MEQFDAASKQPALDSSTGATTDVTSVAGAIEPSEVPSHAVCHTTPKVVLVGPPGAGKSTIGRRLARATNLPLVDSDDLLAEGESMATGDYFAKVGEDKFRETERGYVSQALHSGGIVALGGGAVLNAEVRDMLQGHTVVWIDVSPEEGIRRTSRDTTRPVLAAKDPEAHYRALLESREPFYREVADYRVRTDERPPQRVVAEVLAIIDAD